MPQALPDDLIRRIHNQGKQFVLACTGGGSGAISQLLRVPGGSQSVLEAIVPYSQAALVDLLGSPPEQYCSDRTARAMAMACWLRARRLAPDARPDQLVGLGCTASLASDRPKRGAHRACLAFQSAWQTQCVFIELTRGARDRAEEEDLVTCLALNLLADAAELSEHLPLKLLPAEQLQSRQKTAPAAWHDLLLGRTRALLAHGDPSPAGQRAVFPGAFNPLHHGHRGMADYARRRLQTPVEFELSIENVDKPMLDFIEIEQRVAQFADTPLWLTRAPTFVEKSRVLPGSVFLVGVDTLDRIRQPRYYANDAAACDAAIREIANNGCRFLVFSRARPAGLQTLHDLDIPRPLRLLCDAVAAEDFRDDISSTQLRAQASPNAE